MRVEAFDFTLPADRIAQRPVEPRDASHLLRVTEEALTDFATLDLLPCSRGTGDLLVFNDTRVVPARLAGAARCGAGVDHAAPGSGVGQLARLRQAGQEAAPRRPPRFRARLFRGGDREAARRRCYAALPAGRSRAARGAASSRYHPPCRLISAAALRTSATLRTTRRCSRGRKARWPLRRRRCISHRGSCRLWRNAASGRPC